MFHLPLSLFYFSVPKDVRLNSIHYLNMKINSINTITKEPYYLFTVDTTLPAIDPLRFRNKIFLLKIKVIDQIKVLDKKIHKMKHSII